VGRGRRRRRPRRRPPSPRPGKRVRGRPLSGPLTDVFRLKAQRHCYITATRLRQVRKRRAAARFPPAPAFCPRILARPGKGSSAAAEVPDRATVLAAPEATKTVPPPAPFAASELALGHSDPRPWGGGDGIPADTLASGARTGQGLRPRLGGRTRRERTRSRRHAAAIADNAGSPDTPSGAGKFCFSAFTTTASWPRLAWTNSPPSRSASSWARGRAPTWSAGTPSPLTGSARWPPPRRNSMYAFGAPITRGCALAVPSRRDSRRASGSSLCPSSSSTTCRSQLSWAERSSTTTPTPSCLRPGPSVRRTGPLRRSCGDHWTMAAAR